MRCCSFIFFVMCPIFSGFKTVYAALSAKAKWRKAFFVNIHVKNKPTFINIVFVLFTTCSVSYWRSHHPRTEVCGVNPFSSNRVVISCSGSWNFYAESQQIRSAAMWALTHTALCFEVWVYQKEISEACKAAGYPVGFLNEIAILVMNDPDFNRQITELLQYCIVEWYRTARNLYPARISLAFKMFLSGK